MCQRFPKGTDHIFHTLADPLPPRFSRFTARFSTGARLPSQSCSRPSKVVHRKPEVLKISGHLNTRLIRDVPLLGPLVTGACLPSWQPQPELLTSPQFPHVSNVPRWTTRMAEGTTRVMSFTSKKGDPGILEKPLSLSQLPPSRRQPPPKA